MLSLALELGNLVSDSLMQLTEEGRGVEGSVGGFYKLYLEMASINPPAFHWPALSQRQSLAAWAGETRSLRNGPGRNL